MSLTVKHVFDEKDLKDIYRLRYKIYCYEWGFEKPENHPDEFVTDIYDNNALHFAVKDDAQKTVGAVSLILQSSEGFPTERYCELNINREEIPRDSIAEISRLVIHRDYRRRAEDKYIYGPDEERRSIGSFNYSSNYSNNLPYVRRSDDKYKHKGARRPSESYSERRKRHEVVINLYKAIYRESKRRKITHWYAVMTKGIVILLNKFGFIFKEIGDPVDYHGIRTPYLGNIEKIEQQIMQEHPELYEELNRDL